MDDQNVTLTAVVASPAGERAARASHTASRADAADAVQHVFDELLAGGAGEIIESCREE